MGKTIDFDTDTLSEFCEKCQKLSELISTVKVSGNGKPFSYYDDQYGQSVDSLISNINNNLDSINSHIKSFIANNELADLGDEDYDFDFFSSLFSATSVVKGKVVLADDYLKTMADENGNVTKDGYVYNIETHTLKDPDGNEIVVSYFLPEGANTSQLNTVTIMGGNEDLDVSNKDSKWNGLSDIESGSLIICPKKEEGTLFSSYPVASATIFGDKIIDNPHPVNTIIGCSNGGAAAVTTPARTPGLYQKVIVCNYEPLCEGHNNNKGKSPALLTKDDIKSLVDQGIDITYINCTDDANINPSDELSGGALKESLPYFISVVNEMETVNPDFHITFLTNQGKGGFFSDFNPEYPKAKTLGSWTKENDFIDYSYDIKVFAEFLGINEDEAKTIKGHGPGYTKMSTELLGKLY